MAQTETCRLESSGHHGKMARHGYSLWEYNGKAWTLKKDCTVAGAVPGDAPRVAGRFRGQIRAIPSVVA
jgi:hypothetical protein